MSWHGVACLLGMVAVACIAGCGADGEPARIRPGAQQESLAPANPYAGRTNPAAGDPTAVQAGGKLYLELCAECHGEAGKGDGPTAEILEPAPPDFHSGTLARADDYLLWRIADGGDAATESMMPAWKDDLSEAQMWQVIAFLRSLRAP